MIIQSLLDNDAYKFSMMQAVLHQFPGTEVEYAFKSRNKAEWNDDIVREINQEIDHLCSLTFQPRELTFLSCIPWLKKDYIDFLSLMRLNRKHINAWLNPVTKELEIRIKGSWFLTILFEVPVLAIVNEVYYKHKYPELYERDHSFIKIGRQLLQEKIQLIPEMNFHFSDFGTRRRFNSILQEDVVGRLIKLAPRGSFTGTSNILFSLIYSQKPIGTMAHEWIQCGQNIGVRLIDSQKRMLQAWVDEYRGNLGIALTDTLGVDVFLRDFDAYFAKLYDGVRHDSGDPIAWGEKIIDHYEFLKIDPITKTLVFSDSLTIPRAIEINNHFKNRAKVSFGIGTNLTNDLEGVTPLNVVIKVVKCNGQPVAKISDSPGKGMCEDASYVAYLKSVLKIKE